MISYLQGKLILKQDNFVILDVSGIGYKVFLSDKTLNNISQNAQELKLFTFLRFREPILELYGFLTFEELNLFETLNHISGVGPKTALSLASFGSLENLKSSFEKQPDDFHKQVKGIGQKKLQKIILELTGKIKEIKSKSAPEKNDSLDALLALGVPAGEAKKALSQVPVQIQDTQEKIKQALKFL